MERVSYYFTPPGQPAQSRAFIPTHVSVGPAPLATTSKGTALETWLAPTLTMLKADPGTFRYQLKPGCNNLMHVVVCCM